MKRLPILHLMPALSLALLVGCRGGESTPPPPSPDFHLSVPETTITMIQGNTRAIQVTVKPENSFDGEVGFSLVQTSTEKLGSTFEPATSKTGTKLTLNAPMDLPPNLYTLYIKGVSGDLSDTLELQVNVTKSPLITVGGTLKNLVGNRVQSAKVKIKTFDNQTLEATSDTSGKFSVPGVLAPYSAVVEFPSGETHTFLDLNRPDPTLNLITLTGISSVTPVSISGTLSGGSGFPNPVGTVAEAVYVSLNENVGLQKLDPGKGGAYNIQFNQLNEIKAQGRVMALQWEETVAGASRIPTKYTGYGESIPFLKSGTAAAGVNIALSPVGQSTLSGEVTPLAGMTVVWKNLGASIVPRGGFFLATDQSGATNFSYPVPTADRLKDHFVLAIGAVSTQGSSLILNRANLSAAQTEKFTLLTPPYLNTPADKATNAGNALQWNKGTFNKPFFVLRYQGGAGPNRYVYTTRTSHVDTLSKNTSYKWNLVAYDGFNSADEFTDPKGWTFGYPTTGSTVDFEYGWTREQSFTTAP